MSDLRKAAQQALEALEQHGGHLPWGAFVELRKALRTALAQPEPEPVRRVQKQFMDEEVFYTAPPKCKPLTDQEIIEAIKHISHNEMSAFAIARAIESVLKNASSEANKGTYDNP